MKPTLEEMRQYLEQLNDEALAQLEDSLREALDRLQPNAMADQARRPHLAMHERRHGDRYQVNLDALCTDAIFPENRNLSQEVVIIDLSYAGCQFCSPRRIDPGRIVSLSFADPSGRERQVQVCVVRTRKSQGGGSPAYESGARAVTSREVSRARREFREIEAICRRLANREDIGVLHVRGGDAEDVIRERLRAAHYRVTEHSAPPQFAGDVEGIELILCPAALHEQGETGWPFRLETAQPHLGFLYVAETDEDFAKLATYGGAGRVISAAQVQSDLLLAIDQTLCGEHILRADIEMEPRTFKVLVAGPEERHLRQIETLLLQEDYLVTKCVRQDMVSVAAHREDFQIAILDSSFCLADGGDLLADLRREDPLLTFVVESDEEKVVASIMAKGADLVLSPRANRRELLDRLRRACRMHKTRLYLS